MIRVTCKGDFTKTTRFVERVKHIVGLSILDKYGRKGVEVLESMTPVDSGLTAGSWSYDIDNKKGSAAIIFSNSNVQQGVSIALIVQYGHATGNGGWVEGRDYINPAVQHVFDEMINELWGEVTNL